MAVPQNEIREILKRAVCQYDSNGKPRRVIIVAHSIFADLGMLRNHLGIDLTDRDEYPSILGFLDTEKLSRATLLRSELAFGRWTLQSILETLGIPYANLHTAGNDANFTLKALLMLCIKSLESDDCLDSRQKARLAVVQSLAQASIDSFFREMRFEKSVHGTRGWRLKTERPDRNKLQVTVQEEAHAESMNLGKQERGKDLPLVEQCYRGSTDDCRSECQLGTFSGVLSFQDTIDLLKEDVLPSVAKPISVTANTSTLFIGVDLQGEKRRIPHGDGEDTAQIPMIEGVGFCTLDTESLSRQGDEPQDLLLSTENFRQTKQRKCRYLFGKSKDLHDGTLAETFQHYFSLQNESRRVVLVGYRVQRLLCTLEALKINIPPSIKIIDTRILARTENVKDIEQVNVVKELLQDLGLPDVALIYLNNAGNVANLYMRSFLMLLCTEFEKMDGCTEYQKEKIATLKSIAKDPIQEKLTTPTSDRLAYIREEEIRRAQYLAEQQEQIVARKTAKLKRDCDWWACSDDLDLELAE